MTVCWLAGEAAVVRDAFEELPIAVVALAGPEHRLVAANAGYRAVMGRDEFIRLSMWEVFPDLLGQQIFELIDRVYTSGQPYTLRERCFQTGLDHLASAGVAVLHQAAARNTEQGAPLTLYAPAASTAGHVLTPRGPSAHHCRPRR